MAKMETSGERGRRDLKDQESSPTFELERGSSSGAVRDLRGFIIYMLWGGQHSLDSADSIASPVWRDEALNTAQPDHCLAHQPRLPGIATGKKLAATLVTSRATSCMFRLTSARPHSDQRHAK
jgi:hypothetical protein